MAIVTWEERASKGIVKDFYTTTNTYGTKTIKDPPFLYDTLLDMAEVDPVISTATDLTIDLCTYKGYDFFGKNIRDIERAKKLFNDELDFDMVIDDILYQLIIFGDAYLEVRWNESKTEVKELHALPTQEMAIDYTEHGDIKGYTQKVKGKGKADWIPFDTDEVVRFTLRIIGGEIYSRSPYKPIGRAYSSKLWANSYLQGIFVNLPPKMIYFLKNASKTEKENFIENIRRGKTDSTLDILAQGEEFEAKMFAPEIQQSFIELLKHYQKEILMITRVPPHWIGLLDGANRGIGENVVIPFETRIKKLQQKVASQLNKELLPKLGLANITFRWNAISLLDEKEAIANMAQLKAIGFDSDTIIKYARERGLNLSDDAEIQTSPLESGQTQIQDDSAPSRARNSPKDNMNKGIDSKGVSQAGKAKLDSKKVAA